MDIVVSLGLKPWTINIKCWRIIMNVCIWMKVHCNRSAQVAWAALWVMMIATFLGVTAYIACRVSIDEGFYAVLQVTVRYLDFLFSFSNFYRLNINVRWSFLKLNLARFSIWGDHRTYLKIICSLNILLFRRGRIGIPMADFRTNQYFRPHTIFIGSFVRSMLTSSTP